MSSESSPLDPDPNAFAKRVFVSVIAVWSVIGMGAIAATAAFWVASRVG